MKRKHRQFQQVKAPGDEPEGEGDDTITLLVSTDAMDDEGDVVEQSWDFPSQIPFLWSHKTRDISLGHIVNPRTVSVARLDVEVSEDAEKATLVDVDFDPDDPRAQAVKRKYQREDIEDSSVGFDPDEMERFGDDEPGRFHFLENTLKEVSAVNIGANPDTTTIRKALGGDVDEKVVKSLAGDGEAPDVDPDQTKEGRRNSKRDEAILDHMKECAEHIKGERDPDDMKGCPLHKEGDHDDKSAPSTTVTVEAERIEEIVEEKVSEALDAAQKGDESEGEEKQDEDESEEAQDDALVIDGEKVVELDDERSEQPDGSSGDAGDGDTSEEFEIDELFAQ